VGKISDWKSVPKLLSIVKIAANTDAIMVLYMIFNTAQKKAITIAFSTPKWLKQSCTKWKL
jgi:hypothetical protein